MDREYDHFASLFTQTQEGEPLSLTVVDFSPDFFDHAVGEVPPLEPNQKIKVWVRDSFDNKTNWKIKKKPANLERIGSDKTDHWVGRKTIKKSPKEAGEEVGIHQFSFKAKGQVKGVLVLENKVQEDEVITATICFE